MRALKVIAGAIDYLNLGASSRFEELLMLVQCQGPTDVSSEQITQSKEAVLYVNKVTVPETNGDAITQCYFQ